MVVYSTFQFCLLVRLGKGTNRVYFTKLISPETRLLGIVFQQSQSLNMAIQYTNLEIL